MTFYQLSRFHNSISFFFLKSYILSFPLSFSAPSIYIYFLPVKFGLRLGFWGDVYPV